MRNKQEGCRKNVAMLPDIRVHLVLLTSVLYQADTSARYGTDASDMCKLDVQKAAAEHFYDTPFSFSLCMQKQYASVHILYFHLLHGTTAAEIFGYAY